MFGETKYQTKATLGTDGKATASVTAIKPYGPDDRTATKTVEVTDKKALAAIETALKSAISDEVRKDLEEQVLVDAAESYAHASKRGEYRQPTKTASK